MMVSRTTGRKRCAPGGIDADTDLIGQAGAADVGRHGPFAAPVSFGLRAVHAPLDTDALRVNDSPHGVAFLFRGGIGVYPESRFVHLDVRGSNADWRGS